MLWLRTWVVGREVAPDCRGPFRAGKGGSNKSNHEGKNAEVGMLGETVSKLRHGCAGLGHGPPSVPETLLWEQRATMCCGCGLAWCHPDL